MDIQRKYKDYEEGITVYGTKDGRYEVIEQDKDGTFLVFEKDSKGLYHSIGVRCLTLSQCWLIVRGRERWWGRCD